MNINGSALAGDVPLRGLRVVAYHGDVNLTKEVRLANAATAADGTFDIRINLRRYPLGVNVRVAVFARDDAEIWSSPVHYNAKDDFTVDAVISDDALGVTAFERLTERITPLLQGAAITALDGEQLRYLIGRSGLPDTDVSRLARAETLHLETSKVSAEAFYGLLSQGLPAATLAAGTADDWRTALRAAARGNVIAAQSPSHEATIVTALNARKAAQAVRPASPSVAAPAAFAAAAVSEATQHKVARLAARHDGVNDAFWRAVERHRDITDAERDRLAGYAQLSAIVGTDETLLRAVGKRLTDDGEQISGAAMASVDAGSLADMIDAAAADNDDLERAAVGAERFAQIAAARARTIVDDVAAAYPTAVLRAELKSAPRTNYFGRHKQSIVRFLDHNPNFDLRGDLSVAFNPPDGSDPFKGLPGKAATRARLETLARLSRALPDSRGTNGAGSRPAGPLAAMTALVDHGYDSSSAIADTPRARFVDQLTTKGDEAYWGEVHDSASAVRDIAWLKGIDLLHRHRQPFKVIHHLPRTADDAGTANLRTLFGSLDLCECEECTAVTSPAAYLADILNFLGADVATARVSPYQELVARRPDVPHLLLNCDNTNRPLPYIDLVNELLEDEVLRSRGIEPVWAPHKRVRAEVVPDVLDAATSGIPREAYPARAKVIGALNKALPRYRFDSDTDISVIARGADGGERWHVSGQGFLVELIRTSNTKRVDVEYVSRQTWGTEKELAASPAFRNRRASDELDAAIFPVSLPPALPLLETRLFLNHLQVPRARLIERLAAADVDGWSIEYLDLSAADADLITDANKVPPALAWGFRAAAVTSDDTLVDPADDTVLLTGNWAELLRRVDVLIARAGITYLELLDLLVTDYLNPEVGDGLRPITIVSADESDPATCELRKLRIQGSLNAGRVVNAVAFFPSPGEIGAPDDFLDRLLRFLRLMRRTGWTARELDIAMRQVRPGVLDSTTLNRLALVRWTARTLHLPHPDACALLGALDTRRYVDHAADGQPVIASQYERLFQNREVTTPVDRRFGLDATRDGLANTGLSPGDAAATVAAAFNIGEGEVAALAETAGVTKLTLSALSAIYQRVLFARGFRITIAEVIRLERIAGALPAIDQLRAFVERVGVLGSANLSITEASFLLRGTDAGTAYLQPGDDEIAETLGDLRTELRKVDSDHPVPDPNDPDARLLRTRLGELGWGDPLINELVGAVTDTNTTSVALASLPVAVRKLLTPDPGNPRGVTLSQAAPIPSGVDDLVVFDPDAGRLRALRVLSREDRKRLLLAGTGPAFRNAVELLYALGKLSYADQTLSCRGLLPAAGLSRLATLSQAAAFRAALDDLADRQRQLLRRKLRYCSLPAYELDAGPVSLDLPPELSAYVYYDLARRMLVFRGRLTDAEATTLKSAASPALPNAVVQALPTAQAGTPTNSAQLRDLLVTTAQVDAIFDPPVSASMPATTAAISAALLADLTPHARDLLGRNAVVASLGTALGTSTVITRELVEQGLPSAAGQPRMVDAFLTLAAGDPRAPVDESEYGQLFDDYRRLSKIAFLIERLGVRPDRLPWLFDYAAQGGWLGAADVTTAAAAAGAGLPELAELARLFRLAGRSPFSSALVDELLRRASDPGGGFDVVAFLHERCAWSTEDLTEICSLLQVNSPSDLVNATVLDRLQDALTATGRLGATVAEARELTKRAPDDDDALLARSLAKSKHEVDRWLDVVKPISDTLREARRMALVDYLLAHPRRAVGSGRPLWRDVDGLYAYLLVDVEMSACMTTSRIRFALSSVQLFVQRCLMNLEAHVPVGDDPATRARWDEWDAWRRLYRVWEANRKIFLYPEDWIEPELRDDKTPFYRELEDELLQNDVTQESAEAAFLNYLHKLGEVGKLEVMGLFIEHPRPEDLLPGNVMKRTLHVVARTYADPRQWYYRHLTTTREWHQGLWSPWEKIDADVTGDHVLPVVWNHHLFLFWALFEKRADKPTEQQRLDKDHPQDAQDRWFVKFAWSERTDGRWSPKRVSRQPLRTPAVESGDRSISEDEFSFKTDVSDDSIVIKCYGPTFLGAGTGAGTGGTQNPPPEGHLLARRSANCVIWFLDKDGQPKDTSLTILIYQNGKKLLTLESRDAGGRVDVWNNFGATQQWRDTQVEIRVATQPGQQVHVAIGLQLVPSYPPNTDWWDERNYSAGAAADPLMAQVQVVDGLPAAGPSTGSAAPEIETITTHTISLPGITSTITERIGTFVYLDCHGELLPKAESSPERIPPLETGSARQGTQLRGMQYVANEGEGQFLNSTLQAVKGGRYRVVMPHQSLQPDTTQPFFFQDDLHAYFVTSPAAAASRFDAHRRETAPPPPRQYRFDVFYHPYACNFVGRVNRKGVDELLTLQTQALDDHGTTFSTGYSPSTRTQQVTSGPGGTAIPVTREYVDFARSSSYSIYNWELFFHIPMHIAARLNANQRFNDCRHWLHYLFDPTTRPGAFAPATAQRPTQRFWNVRPFWEIEGTDIHSISEMLSGAEDLSDQYAEWRAQPFHPYAVARLRPTAFMQSVVMRYIDNLLDWGDQQFGLFTMESTNEATLLYTLAAEILGRRPELIPARARPALQTYLSMHTRPATSPAGPDADAWRQFSDLMVEIETYVAPSGPAAGAGTGSVLGRMWAFCIPSNATQLEYWHRVADRLFKLRHCRDLEGAQRRIPLLGPADRSGTPGARRRGGRGSRQRADRHQHGAAALPLHRAVAEGRRAVQRGSRVRRRAPVRAGEEGGRGAGPAAFPARARPAARGADRQGRTAGREPGAHQGRRAVTDHGGGQARPLSRPAVHHPGGAGRPGAGRFRGDPGDRRRSQRHARGDRRLGSAVLERHLRLLLLAGARHVLRRGTDEPRCECRREPGALDRFGLVYRIGDRADRRRLPAAAGGMEAAGDAGDQGTRPDRPADRGGQIREAIAQGELDNHDQQTDNAHEVDDFLRGKYSNQELYGWTAGSALRPVLPGVQARLRRRAQGRACLRPRTRHAPTPTTSGSATGTACGSGLLAGERLHNDLRRMEVAYLDQNRREFEITKHISLAALDPAALVTLKATGSCTVELPECGLRPRPPRPLPAPDQVGRAVDPLRRRPLRQRQLHPHPAVQ